MDEKILLDPKFRPDLLAHEERESQQSKSEREAQYAPGQAYAEHDRYTNEQPEWPVFHYSTHGSISFYHIKLTLPLLP